MRVHIVDIRRGQAGPFQRRLHGAVSAITIFGRRGDVIGVAGHAVTLDFGIDGRAPGPGVFQLFKNNDARALAHHKAITPLVPWT